MRPGLPKCLLVTSGFVRSMEASVDLGIRRESPLLIDMSKAAAAIGQFKVRVRAYFYAVSLFGQSCPSCGGPLKMYSEGVCACPLGHRCDPTEAFQQSQCCAKRLVKRRLHYVCRHCGAATQSRFLFDARVMDADYFRDRMREARQRQRARTVGVRRLLVDSRSDAITLDGVPDLDTVPDLVGALDAFVGIEFLPLSGFEPDEGFDLSRYREAILSFLGGVSASFNAIPSLSSDVRRDRTRRFVALIYLEHEREVRLTQYRDDILVEAYGAD